MEDYTEANRNESCLGPADPGAAGRARRNPERLPEGQEAGISGPTLENATGTAKTRANYGNFTEQIEPAFRLIVDEDGGRKLKPEAVACDTKRGDVQ
jgi:hypothetical protein